MGSCHIQYKQERDTMLTWGNLACYAINDFCPLPTNLLVFFQLKEYYF